MKFFHLFFLYLFFFFLLPPFQTRSDGEKAPILRSLHRGLSALEEDEVGPGLGPGVGKAHRRVHGHLRARRPAGVGPRPGRDQELHRGGHGRQRPGLRLQ